MNSDLLIFRVKIVSPDFTIPSWFLAISSINVSVPTFFCRALASSFAMLASAFFSARISARDVTRDSAEF